MFKILKKSPFLICISAISLFATTQAHAESNWLPHTGRVLASGTAASDVRTIGGDGMLPIYGNQEGFAFADFMGDYGSDDTYLVSPGGGYRQILNNQIIGGYFFADYEKTSLGQNFWVLSPGVEWMNAHWDAHINGYFPTETSEKTGSADFLNTFGDSSGVFFETGTHNQYDELVAPYAVIGNGVDAEIAYSFAELSGLRSRVYLGGYYYTPPSSYNVDNITGITAGFEQPISKNLNISLFNSYDNVSNYTIGVALTATFGQDSTVFSNNIHDRLLDPVQRHVGIIDTGAGTYDQQSLESVGTGLQYGNVYFIAPTAEGSADGTYGNAAPLDQTTLNSIDAESPDDSNIYIQGGSDATYIVDSTTATGDPFYGYYGLQVYNGQNFYGRTADYTASADSNEQPIISVDGVDDCYGFIVTEGESTFSDLSITQEASGDGVGIFAINVTDDDVIVTTNHVNAYGLAGGIEALNVTNTGSITMNLLNSTFNENSLYGFAGENDTSTGTLTINARNSQFNSNAEDGFTILNLNNTGSVMINISDSEFNNNAEIGAVVENLNNEGGITVNVSGSEFNHNGNNGLSSINTGTGTSTISATSSEFYNNTSAGLSVSNMGTGTLDVISLVGSSFSNPLGYHIEARGSATGTTIVNYKGAIGVSASTTNESTSNYVEWIS